MPCLRKIAVIVEASVPVKPSAVAITGAAGSVPPGTGLTKRATESFDVPVT